MMNQILSLTGCREREAAQLALAEEHERKVIDGQPIVRPERPDIVKPKSTLDEARPLIDTASVPPAQIYVRKTVHQTAATTPDVVTTQIHFSISITSNGQLPQNLILPLHVPDEGEPRS